MITFQRNKEIDEGSLDKYGISYFIYFEQYDTSSLKNTLWEWNDFWFTEAEGEKPDISDYFQ